jgi:hypothetical protein
MPFHEIGQNIRIAQAELSAQTAVSNAADAEEQIKLLQKRVDRLALLCQTLWAFLQEDRLLTEQDLLEKMKEVEQHNGRQDGRTVQARPCGSCGRPLNPKQPKCIYCGAEKSSSSVFDSL